MFKKIFYASIFILMLNINIYAAPSDFKEGVWEITSTMSGMPGMSNFTTTFTMCMTKDNYIPTEPDKSENEQNCKNYDIKVKGNTVSWKMECKNDDVITKGYGEMTYKGKNFEGKTVIEQEGMQFTQNIKGKWLSPCKSKK